MLTALLPAPEQVALGRPADPNALCTSFLLEWENCRLLLGADALEVDWNRVDGAHELHRHGLYKVAHHASSTRLTPRLSVGHAEERTRFWTATPWNRGLFKLPRFDDGQGVSRILSHVDRLHLTALPFLPADPPRGRTLARRLVEELRSGTEIALADDLVVLPVAAESEAIDGVIWIGLDRAGTPSDVRYGPDSLIVVEDALGPYSTNSAG